MKLAILIAVQTYNDPFLDTIPFADANAALLGEQLQRVGYEEANQISLVNEQATKAAIESKVRRAIKSCIEEDELWIYFSSHAFSCKGIDYLACIDSDPLDLPGTSIPMTWLVEQLRNCDCKQIVMFLDSGETHKFLQPHSSGIEVANHVDLKSYFDTHEHAVCFTACLPGEASHVSRKWKHGIWVHHLLEALNGNAISTLRDKSLLDVLALQKYLARSVSQTLITLFSSKSHQSPTCYCTETPRAVVANLESLMEARRSTSSPYADLSNCVTFYSNRISSVKSLSGFKKGNAVPDRANMAAQTFVAQLAATQISEDLKSVYVALKAAFKFKRADVTVTDVGDGTGTITTPFFNYSISIEVDPSDPSQVVWRRTVDAIKEPDQIFSDKFASVFGTAFEAVEFAIPNQVDVNLLIDSVEAIEDDRIRIEYDSDATHCSLSIDGITGEIQVSSDSIRIVHQRAETPAYLLRSFFSLQKSLVGDDGTTLIPIGNQHRH